MTFFNLHSHPMRERGGDSKKISYPDAEIGDDDPASAMTIIARVNVTINK